MTDTYVPRQDEIVYNGSIYGIFYMYQLFMTSDQIRILYSWTQKKMVEVKVKSFAAIAQI